MKKIMILVLITILAVSLIACGNTRKPVENSSSTAPSNSDVKIPNPFTDYDTLEEAEALVGFDVEAPDVIGEYSQRTIRVIKDEMIEIIYGGNEDEVCLRKAAGTQDISGDYNQYAENNTVTVDEQQVTMRGADGKVYVAVWSNGDYSYSISFVTGMDSQDTEVLIKTVK